MSCPPVDHCHPRSQCGTATDVMKPTKSSTMQHVMSVQQLQIYCSPQDVASCSTCCSCYRHVIVKPVVLVGPIGVHKTDCFEETRLVLQVPSLSRAGKRIIVIIIIIIVIIMMIMILVIISSCTGGSGFGGQTMRSSGGSGVGRFSHGHTSSAGSTADWGSGSGNWSPSSAGQPHVIVPCSEKSNVLSPPVSLVQFAVVVLTMCLCTVCCWC